MTDIQFIYPSHAFLISAGTYLIFSLIGAFSREFNYTGVWGRVFFKFIIIPVFWTIIMYFIVSYLNYAAGWSL